jgi:alpha-mannosidase
LIQKGTTGGLIIFEDRPNYWDAWGTELAPVFLHYDSNEKKTSPDVEIHHLETWKPLEFSNIHIVAEGPLRASVASKIKYGQSSIDVLVSYKDFSLR